MKTNTIRERLLASTMMGGVAIAAAVALPAAAVLVAPTAALAQTTTGSLRIAVTGDGGAPLPGATVTVSSPDSLVTRSGVTGVDGSVRLGGLDPATNYTVNVSADGYEDINVSNVAVVSGRDLSLGYVLISGAGATDATNLGDVVITGTSLAAVDVTSATVGTTLTLDTVESLPTGRSYQSYLQLVPGTKPGSNPSSRSGVNYSDIGGSIGSSSDNLYYLDGVDVTDPTTGTFGANFNSEIIQEQSVIVGGVPAEYAGGSGLISRVITKSGGNEWHGSVNYYFQNDQLVAEDEHATSNGFSTYDAAVTLGGPIIRDRLWFFGSYQVKNSEDEVLRAGTDDLLRTVTTDSEYAFAKATWQITNDDRLSVTYFSDPFERDGSTSSSVLNNRSISRIQGGENYKVDYSRTWGDLLINAYWFSHTGEVSDVSADQRIRDNLIFRNDANSTVEQRSLGGGGTDIETFRNRDEFGLNFEYFLDTDFGSHTIKAGYTKSENTYEEDSVVPGGGTYQSLAAAYAGVNFTTASRAASSTFPGWTARPIVVADNDRIRDAIGTSATATAAVDTNGDGDISDGEIGAITFSDTTGNPYGNVNLYRAQQTVVNPYSVTSEGQALYIQDTWTLNQLTISAGLRGERWEHFDSKGNQSALFDWDIAPRLSVVYDLVGDGRSKVFGFVGRYYDPVRNNMSDFAGALTGPVTEEQINVYGEWLTFRVRGGEKVPDALFSPTTKTPYTDEYMLGYSTTFGDSVGFTASVTHRATRDILEDFDLHLYSDPTATAADGAFGRAFPGSPFYIPLSYFGYETAPFSNYVIGTLPGGKRDYTGFELVLTKYRTDNWFGQISYTHNSAKGNTNSDSNADFQGDLIALDPRGPNAFANQPGNIEHQLKAYASYAFDFGLEVSGVFNWNSGSLYTPAESVSGRYFAPLYSAQNLCGEDDPSTPRDDHTAGYYFNGVCDTYLRPGFIGSETNPDYYTFDMKFTYDLDLPIGGVEFFLDVFNVLNNQAATSVMPLLSGSGVYDYQEENAWVSPRRAYLGVRYSF